MSHSWSIIMLKFLASCYHMMSSTGQNLSVVIKPLQYSWTKKNSKSTYTQSLFLASFYYIAFCLTQAMFACTRLSIYPSPSVIHHYDLRQLSQAEVWQHILQLLGGSYLCSDSRQIFSVCLWACTGFCSAVGHRFWCILHTELCLFSCFSHYLLKTEFEYFVIYIVLSM